MVITSIKLNTQAALPSRRPDRLLALVSVQFDNMVTVYGIRVIQRISGEVKIKMPSRVNRREQEAECLVLNSAGLQSHMLNAIREALEDEGCLIRK